MALDDQRDKETLRLYFPTRHQLQRSVGPEHTLRNSVDSFRAIFGRCSCTNGRAVVATAVAAPAQEGLRIRCLRGCTESCLMHPVHVGMA